MKHLMYFFNQLHQYGGKILYVNLFGSMIISVLDGVSIILLLPLLSVIGIIDVGSGSIPGLAALNFLQTWPLTHALLFILGLYISVVALQSFIGRNLTLREVRIHTGFINYIRLETYRALLASNWGFFVKKRKSDLINAMTGELGRVTSGTFIFLQLLGAVIFTVIQVGIALWLSLELTLLVLLCGVAVGWLSRRFIRQSKQQGGVAMQLAQEYIANMTDHFNGMKDIKINALEEKRYRWLRDWSISSERERYAFTITKSNSGLFYKLSSVVLIAIFVFAAIQLFQTQGMQLLLITLIFSRLWPRFTGIQANMEQIAAAMPAFKALMELQQDCARARELDVIASPLANARRGAEHQSLKMTQSLACRDIHFRYEHGQSSYTLEGINLTVHAGSMTAIVGRSGAGKSTLTDLLMGLIVPERGQLLIDGVALGADEIMRLRRSIGYVPQDSFLYHGTIRDNLRLTEADATDEQLWEAMEFSSAAEFVRELPDELDTVIGDRGVLLPGGERQRLVLARALLGKPSILILDEATSALDTLNETKIQEALAKLKGSMTIIIIAHRLSTVSHADQVIVLERGKVVQVGSFESLSHEESGLFSHLLGLPVAL